MDQTSAQRSVAAVQARLAYVERPVSAMSFDLSDLTSDEIELSGEGYREKADRIQAAIKSKLATLGNCSKVGGWVLLREGPEGKSNFTAEDGQPIRSMSIRGHFTEEGSWVLSSTQCVDGGRAAPPTLDGVAVQASDIVVATYRQENLLSGPFAMAGSIAEERMVTKLETIKRKADQAPNLECVGRDDGAGRAFYLHRFRATDDVSQQTFRLETCRLGEQGICSDPIALFPLGALDSTMTGQIKTFDGTIKLAFKDAVGALPHEALSDGYGIDTRAASARVNASLTYAFSSSQVPPSVKFSDLGSQRTLSMHCYLGE